MFIINYLPFLICYLFLNFSCKYVSFHPIVFQVYCCCFFNVRLYLFCFVYVLIIVFVLILLYAHGLAENQLLAYSRLFNRGLLKIKLKLKLKLHADFAIVCRRGADSLKIN